MARLKALPLLVAAPLLLSGCLVRTAVGVAGDVAEGAVNVTGAIVTGIDEAGRGPVTQVFEKYTRRNRTDGLWLLLLSKTRFLQTNTKPLLRQPVVLTSGEQNAQLSQKSYPRWVSKIRSS